MAINLLLAGNMMITGRLVCLLAIFILLLFKSTGEQQACFED